jgi:hypothetical protein
MAQVFEEQDFGHVELRSGAIGQGFEPRELVYYEKRRVGVVGLEFSDVVTVSVEGPPEFRCIEVFPAFATVVVDMEGVPEGRRKEQLPYVVDEDTLRQVMVTQVGANEADYF